MSASGIETPIGRESELATAEALLDPMGADADPGALPQARALLVVGDAGVGKTTLVRAILAVAEGLGLSTGEGHCLDLATGTPFAPVKEALRQVVAAMTRVGRPLPPAARWLSDDDVIRGEARERLLGATSALAIDRGLVLVIEDLHWSDRSTRDYALSLVRTSRAPVLLVVTARSDDLVGDHPGRPALSEIALSPGAVRLDLAPLDAAGVALLAERRLDRMLGKADLASVFKRSGGNPLYAEEIMKTIGETVPASLHDLLVRHVTALSAPAAAIVRLASVGGGVIDIDLLREASGLDAATFEALVHEALTAGVFTRHGDLFEFRHALIRDAVEEDLLPSERVALHREYVDVLRERAQVGSAAARWRANAALAVHAEASDDAGTALSAHVKAGLAAKQHGAPEAADHLETALVLWPSVPNAAELAGFADAELAALAAESLNAIEDGERIGRLLREARDRLDHVTDPLAASRVLTIFARDWRDRDGLIESRAASDRAIALASDEPSQELAKAWSTKATLHVRRHEFEQALKAAEKGTTIAHRVGSPLAEHHLRFTAAVALNELGRLSAARAATKVAVALAEHAAAPGYALAAQGELARELICAGRLDEGCALARQGEAAALREGLAFVANFNGEVELTALIWQGRLDEARQRLDELIQRGFHESRRRAAEVKLLVTLGDHEPALAMEERSIEADILPSVYGQDNALRRVDLFEQLGDVARELDAAQVLLAHAETEAPVRAAIQARCALQALCAAATTGHATPDGLAQTGADALGVARRGLTEEWDRSVYGAQFAMAEAYAARLDHRPAVEEWARAVVVAKPFGAFFALRPQLELAREQLRHGERDAGKEQLLSVWRSAEPMGARWFADQAIAEARRHRVPLPAAPDRPPSPLDRLTPRETEVLGLLAEGATNHAIAKALSSARRRPRCT
ncbi:helix-turn-helix transcriptional regulator [Monashia sp. NPDC004114]